MKLFCIFISILVISFTADILYSGEIPAPSVSIATSSGETLPALIEELLLNNPSIRAARETTAAAKERIAIEKAWADPMLGFMVMPTPTAEMTMLSGARNTEISQQIPLGGQKRLAGRIAETGMKIVQVEESLEKLTQIESLKIAFEEIAYLDAAIEILTENQKVLDQISGMVVSKSSYSVLLSEIQRIQTQLSQAAYDEGLLRELRTAELAKLNALLNRPIDRPIRIVGDTRADPPPASLAILLDLAQQRQPDIRMAEFEKTMARQEISMAWKERVPEFTLGWRQQRDKSWRQDTRGNILTFDFSLPVWGGKNVARVSEAKHKALAAQEKLTATRNSATANITGQFVRIQNLWRTVRIYEDRLLPQALAALEGAQSSSFVRENQPLESIEAQAVYLNFCLAHRRAVADYRQALARLETLTGPLPDGTVKQP